MEKATRPHNRFRQMRGGLVAALIGVAVGSGSILFIQGFAPAIDTLVAVNPLLPLVLLIASIFLVVLVHELGHLAGGAIGGMQPVLLVVGPLRLQREGKRLRLRLNRSLTLAGGVAAAIPPDSYQLRQRMTTMVAGGPLASLLLAVLGLGASVLPVPTGLMLFALITGLVSALICLVTLLPIGTGGLQSDGSRLLMFARGGPTLDRYLASLVLVSSTLGGIRPRNWSPDVVAQAVSLPDDSIDHRSATLLAYSHTLDRGSIEQAGQMLDAMLQQRDEWPAPFRPSLDLEGAFYLAQHRQQAQAARDLFERGKAGPLVSPSTRLAAEAAVLAAEGKRAEAAAKARNGLAKLSAATDAGAALVERDRLQALAE